MNERTFLTLLNHVWGDLQSVQGLWQILTLLVSLGVAYGLTRGWQQWRSQLKASLPQAAHAPVHDARLIFPLLALLLIFLLRAILKSHIHVHVLNVVIPLLGSLVIVRAVIHILRQAFAGTAWLAPSEKLLATLVWGWLFLELTDLSPLVVDSLDAVSFQIGRQHLSLWQILNAVLVILTTLMGSLWTSGLLESWLNHLHTLDSSLRIVLSRTGKALVTVLGLLIGLSLLGIDITALSVFTGALGVGLGFGLQKIASNYVSGFILLLDRSIKIGNIIQLDENTKGSVTQITTRYTVLRQSNGIECLVPNESLIGTIVKNQSYSDRCLRLHTRIGVAYDTDLELAMRLLEAAAAESPRVLETPAPEAVLLEFGESAIQLELGYWITDPEKGVLDIRSEVNLRLWSAFREHGISVPFPQAEVRILQSPS